MQIKRFVSLFVTAAFVAAVLMAAGCSGESSEDGLKNAPEAKKPGSLPPPSDLPGGAMKKAGK